MRIEILFVVTNLANLSLVSALLYLPKFYLRTSRQMRLLDLEAKSPLYTHLTETLDGIRTIQMEVTVVSPNLALIDLSQRPFYLLLCLQNWLNLVLDISVTCFGCHPCCLNREVAAFHEQQSTRRRDGKDREFQSDTVIFCELLDDH